MRKFVAIVAKSILALLSLSSVALLMFAWKPLGELSIGEIAFIVTLPRTPLPGKGFDIARRNVAIDRMLQAGAISSTQAATAKQLPLELKETPASVQNRRDNP